MAGTFKLSEGYVKNLNPRAGTENYKGNVALVTKYDLIDEYGKGIGYITGITPNDNRPTTLIRHISSADAGRVLEQAPSPSTITLSITGFALYDFADQAQGSVIQRLATNFGLTTVGGAIATLEEQKIGFKIRERQVNPVTNQATIYREYQDCWLTSYSAPKQIGTMTIAETVNISCSRVQVYRENGSPITPPNTSV